MGTVIAGRFTLESVAGRGGMGFVYRAHDARTGLPVALKLLHSFTAPEAFLRFNRESVLLTELSHPAIVSHVEHGRTEGGEPFLAMEWLDGVDLSHRLALQPLTLSESLALVKRIAEGLSEAHRRGIVHRDIKPSNLFLRGGRPEDVVLLDFGLARTVEPSLVAVTGSETVVGTPGYMAPEQASSQPDLFPSADIFSLGCVLYQCLTGKPPFAAPHFAAVLAKILFAEPAPLRALRAELPFSLQRLVDRMLVKDPRKRLPDADRLLEALAALETVPDRLPPGPSEELRPRGLAGAEQQLVSVLLVSLQALTAGAGGQEAIDARGVEVRDSLRTALAPYGARVELLADGSLVATLVLDQGTATDQAALAARCALTFKERWPEAAVVLTTGRSVLSERLPVGEAMDRAGRLLRGLERQDSSALVVLDEVTAGLLGPGFQLSRGRPGAFLLQGEFLSSDESRPLLGKPTPCVGREQELALLEFTLNTCIEEPASRALLVTAPAGTGKSRLRHEFLRRLERREQPPLVLLGRGDPMSAGSSHGLLGQALRRLCGVTEGESLEARRARLQERVAQNLPAEEAQEVVEFLGELCAIPFPEEGSPRLHSARGDPRLMSAQMGRALVAFFTAECSQGPVLLVLEDLHWSDALTVKLVDEMLRELVEQPFLVLALARPEVKELFPNLWSRRLQEMQLSGLSRKAGARLVREVLGSQVSDSVVQRAVELSAGNALFLEELIRMVVEGRGDALPETVLAVLQARLSHMSPEIRQVLLAASIFGRTFWSGGVRELLGGQGAGERLEEHLRRLVELEVIEPQSESRFLSVNEYRFRHALLRDAAYGLVSDSHRPASHRLAGEWLEQMGEPDPMELATHYQLGLRLERAGHFYIQAAERLFERHDLPGTLRGVEAALACGVGDEELVRLRALQSVVAFWMDDLMRSLVLGSAVLDELEVGSRLWCWLVGGLIFSGVYCDRLQDKRDRLKQLLLNTHPDSRTVAAYLWALACMGLALVLSGDRPGLDALLRRMQEVGADAMSRGWTNYVRGFFLHHFEARPWQAVKEAEQSIRDFRAVSMERDALVVQTFYGLALAGLGDVPAAVDQMEEVMIAGRRIEAHLVGDGARYFLSPVLASSSDPAHQREVYALAVEWVKLENSYSYRQGLAHAVLAKVMAGRGELREAEPHARQACELLAPFGPDRVFARTCLSNILLGQGRVAEAREVAAQGVQGLEEMGSSGVYAAAMRLALVEACLAQGDSSAGEAALRKALECVMARASDIPDAAARERFLRQVPENARILKLLSQRWGDPAA